MHCFLHLPFTFSQFFILHLLVSVRSPHLSSGADGGDADGGSASHWSQVFLHCFFSSSEYLFLHFDFLQVKSVASSVHVSSGGGESGGGEGLGGGGDGDGSGGEGEGGGLQDYLGIQ